MLILKRPVAIAPPVIAKPDMPRQLALLATQTARNKAAQVKVLFKIKHWRTWAELTRDTGMRVTSQHSGGPFTEAALDQFLSDYIALAACILLGMLFVVALPVRAWVRALLAAAYAPLAFAVLVAYSLVFVGLAFGDWL